MVITLRKQNQIKNWKENKYIYIYIYIYINEWNDLLSKKRETILNRAKKYYENSKERLREKARNKYKKLSDEKKYITREYGRNR